MVKSNRDQVTRLILHQRLSNLTHQCLPLIRQR